MNKKSNKSSYFEGKWIREQVEGHLLFGLYNTSKRPAWISVLYFLYFCIFFMVNHSIVENNGIKILGCHLIALALIIYFAYFSNFSQSVIFWLSTKITLAFMSFVLCLLGFVNMLRDYSNWFLWIILGLVWLPSLEFYPTISRYQKALDVLRLLVTLFICTVVGKDLK